MNGDASRKSEMKKRRLGFNGPEVSPLGLGCFGMSHAYGPAHDAESTVTIQRALDLGCNFFDTADSYGAGQNERLLGVAIAGRRKDLHEPDAAHGLGLSIVQRLMELQGGHCGYEPRLEGGSRFYFTLPVQ